MTRHWPPIVVAMLCCLLADSASASAAAQQPSSGTAPRIFEYTDNQYSHAFQYPSNWKIQPTPPPSEAGEVRVVIQSSTKRSQVMAIVGRVGKSITREQFESSPNREAAVDVLIERTVEQVYKRFSRTIGASSIVVNERRALPSDVGIKLYISAANTMTPKGRIIGLAGQHIMPFGKNYMVSFVMMTPVDPKATAENETITNIFNSFHIAGERWRPFSSAEERRTSATCTDYSTLEQNQKTEVAYGYLEGVQAALDKLPFDILVPPSDPKHPLRWVLPARLGENLFTGLAKTLDAHCQPAQNKQEAILDAFLSIASQKEGEPSLGISFDKQRTDPWKKFLGGSVSCSAYSASPQGARNAIIYGYYLGTEAITRVTNPKRSTTGRSSDLRAWPSKSTPQAVRVEVDKACQKGNEATLRDVLWVTTVELVVKEGGPPQPEGK